MRIARIWGVIGGVAAVLAALLPGAAQAAAPTTPYSVMAVQVPTRPTVVADAANSTFQFTYRQPDEGVGNREAVVWAASVSNEYGGSTFYAAKIYSAAGQRLSAGTTYASGAGLNAWTAIVTNEAQGCRVDTGTFTVHDLTRDAQDAITSIAVSVHYPSCGLRAELRYRSPTGYTAWDVTRKVDLGKIDVHATTPVTGSVTVTASGTEPTTIGSIGLGDDASSVLSVTGGTCAVGVTLAYGQTCTVQLAAKAVPTVTTYTFGLHVGDTTGRSREIPVSVTGTVTSAGNFYPVGPVRIVDTRSALGGYSTLGPDSHLYLAPNVHASALVLNVTVVNATADSFLTLYPAGNAAPPTASSINFPKAAVLANSVTVATGTGGGVAVYNRAGRVDVIVDLVGYYADASGSDNSNTTGGQFFPHTPTRVLDTRNGLGQVPGNSEVVLPVGYGVQANPHVRALAVNVTAVNARAGGFLTVNGASDDALHQGTSLLNFTAGAVVPNMAVVPTIMSAGLPTISIANRSSAAVDIVVDVVGYYDDGLAAGGLHFRPALPTRLIDTRQSGAVGPNSSVTVTGPAAHALALNVTGVQPTTGTYLTVWPAGVARPTSSTLNLNPGEIRSNAAITGLGAGNRCSVYNAGGSTHVVVDLAGTFDPLPGTVFPAVTTPAAGTPRIVP
ncbi:hypothetical protein ACFPIJ_24905 [Dactylosporangium cerinum]|uniref:Uncharacterized protein n=1 Tax=Dactylosporangium cerinum TaxID=1434730 RepID=A0ABV9W1E0_9ACTN